MYKDVRSRVRVGDGYRCNLVFELVFIRALSLAHFSSRDFLAILGRGPRAFKIGKISAVNH